MANLQCETLVLFLFSRLWKALLESTAKAAVTVSSKSEKGGLHSSDVQCDVTRDCDTRGLATWQALDSIFQLVLH